MTNAMDDNNKLASAFWDELANVGQFIYMTDYLHAAAIRDAMYHCSVMKSDIF